MGSTGGRGQFGQNGEETLHSSLKLDNFTNIRRLRSNFFERESFLESSSPDILAICETNLDDSIDSGNFCVRGYLPLIRKDSVTLIYGLAVYVKEGVPFARDSDLCFRLDFPHSLFYFFFCDLLFYFFYLLRLYAQFLMLFHLT